MIWYPGWIVGARLRSLGGNEAPLAKVCFLYLTHPTKKEGEIKKRESSKGVRQILKRIT